MRLHSPGSAMAAPSPLPLAPCRPNGNGEAGTREKGGTGQRTKEHSQARFSGSGLPGSCEESLKHKAANPAAEGGAACYLKKHEGMVHPILTWHSFGLPALLPQLQISLGPTPTLAADVEADFHSCSSHGQYHSSPPASFPRGRRQQEGGEKKQRVQ